MGNNQREKKGFPGWLGGVGALIAGGIPSILKLGKFGGTLISMAVSAWAYSLVLQFPWSFSIGLVVMIFIHEMGHIWAARRKGLPVSAPAFIPFLGALIMMKKQPQDAVTEAYIAFGGPLVGTVGASLTYLVAWWTGYEVLYPVALIGFFINLFNLLPIHPLDGGRIVTAISRWLWVVGLVLGLLLVWVLKSFLLLLIWFLFTFQLWSSYLSRRRHQPRRLETTVEVDPVAFDSRGVSLPRPKEYRDLSFIQYCSLEEREHVCDVYYPGIGLIHRLEGFRGVFQKIRLLQTETQETEDGPRIRMKLETHYLRGAEEQMLRSDAEYYAVPPRTRLGYGLAYMGLAGFLLFMVMMVGRFSFFGPRIVS